MAYDILYGADAIKYEIQERNSGKQKRTVALIAAVCAIAMGLFILRTPQVRDFLIPGDKEVTRAALADMVQDIQNGEDISEAITAFCRDIITHAEVE